MRKYISISLGIHYKDFVESKIFEGRFKNASEVIRAGLQLLEEEENKIKVLSNALVEGINSGIYKNFDSEKHF